jgi:hypothetical protein
MLSSIDPRAKLSERNFLALHHWRRVLERSRAPLPELIGSFLGMESGETRPDEALRRRRLMATQTVQQVVDYLKTHPDVARKAKEYFKAHPEDVKAALKEVAEERGWDLSSIDTSALKAEIGKIN